MNITQKNPNFTGLGQVIKLKLGLEDLMPIGRNKDIPIGELLVSDTSYMRWFQDNVTNYCLSIEALKMLVAIEEDYANACDPDEDILGDILW